MKKLLLSSAFIFFNLTFGQITLERSYASENLQVYTNATETYYYSVGQNSTIKIYNGDFTLRKQFTLSSPVFISFYDTFILSKHIFNSDNLLEIVVVENINTGSYNSTIKIYNEDGVLVKDFGPGYQFDDEPDFHVFHDFSTNTNKLRLYKYSTSSTEIYNLRTTSLSSREIQDKNRISAFPIPTNKTLNVINPNIGNNKIEVFDTSGKMVISKNFQVFENIISLDIENLPKGNYIYKIGGLSSKFIKN